MSVHILITASIEGNYNSITGFMLNHKKKSVNICKNFMEIKPFLWISTDLT